MNKAELLTRLETDHQQWLALLAEIGEDRMEQPGVNGEWSFKDMLGHLTGWQRRLVANFDAAQRGEPAPPTAWPAELQSDDDVNAWLYAASRDRSLHDLLSETEQLHQQLVGTIERLPDGTRIELHEPTYYLVWIGDERFEVSEFFNHFRDDHEPDVRAWLERTPQA
jgi:hypothetical protein